MNNNSIFVTIAERELSQKKETLNEMEAQFKVEFGENPEYLILPVGRNFSAEITNAKNPAKEWGAFVEDAKISALQGAIDSMQEG